MENNKKKIIIAILIVLAVIIVIGFIMYTEEKQKVKPKENTVTVTAIDDEDFYSNIEEEEEERFEEDYSSIEMFLDTYNLRKSGAELLYTQDDNHINGCQWLYMNSEEKEINFKESEEKIMVGEDIYNAYQTQIDYNRYKEELLKIMSEEMFEKYFTEYAKNINGVLFITNEEPENLIIESVEAIDENQYDLRYKTGNEEKEAVVIINQESREITQINL